LLKVLPFIGGAGQRPLRFLLRGEVPEFVFHALVATDVEGDNVRVVTMYLPDSGYRDEGGRFRRP
jgi:hypothetical protein